MRLLDDLRKNKTAFLLIIAFILFGFYLRSYHLDSPSIGYHNMKENEYLSQAHLQSQRGEYLRRPMHILGTEETPYFEEYPQMPLLPWAFQLAWFFTGEQFWAARAIIVLFSVLTIPILYLLTKRLTKDEYLSLTAAFLFSFMPLAVFFGRNIQPETPALFFTVLAMYLWTYYLESYKRKDLLKAMGALAITGLLKPTFLIVLLPMLCLFPLDKLRDKIFLQKRLYDMLYGLLPLLAIPLWMSISKLLNTKNTLTGGTLGRVELFRVFTASYWVQFWPAISAYIMDNYTWTLTYFALFGLVFACFKYRTKFSRFLIGYMIAIAPYLMILSDYVKGHNYYQFPFLPLVCMSVAYFLYTLGTLLKQFVQIPYVQYAALLLLLIPMGDVEAAINRQYDTIFYGEDVVADYLRAHKQEGERLLKIGHSQSVGVCYNADMWCGNPVWDDLEATKKLVDDGFHWVFIHGVQGLQVIQQPKQQRREIWDFLQNNFHITLIGLGPRQAQGQPLPEVILLRRGGNFSLDGLDPRSFRQREKVYDTTGGEVSMVVLER